MRIRTPRIKPRLAAALCAAALVPMGASLALAADHIDAPGASDDAAADIGDLYAWHADGKVVAVLTFGAFQEAGSTGTYDPDVLYGFHIDNDGDNEPDHDVWVRFGQNGAGEDGVQVLGLPGADAEVTGSVDTVLDAGGELSVYAGPRDDPFFFDFEGFVETLDTATLSFDAERDSFKDTNVTAIVVEIDADAAAEGADSISIWATSARE